MKMKKMWIVLVLLMMAGQAEVHEGPPQRPRAQGPIDPRQSFPFLVLSGAGGHFHTLLPLSNLRTLFAGTHLGLFRSEDLGLNWRLVAPRFSGEGVHGLARDPRTGVLYTVTHGQGLLRSRDGGRRWDDSTGKLPSRDLHALALDLRDPPMLYVWVVGYGLFRSGDGGRRWTQLTEATTLIGVGGLAVHPEKPERFYAGTEGGVWVSHDGGRHWHFPQGGLPYKTAGLLVPPWRPDLLFAATLEGAFVGKADGTGWEPLPPHPTWWGPLVGFAFLPDDPDTVFAVMHEGVVAALKLIGGEWTPVAQLGEVRVP